MVGPGCGWPNSLARATYSLAGADYGLRGSSYSVAGDASSSAGAIAGAQGLLCDKNGALSLEQRPPVSLAAARAPAALAGLGLGPRLGPASGDHTMGGACDPRPAIIYIYIYIYVPAFFYHKTATCHPARRGRLTTGFAGATRGMNMFIKQDCGMTSCAMQAQRRASGNILHCGHNNEKHIAACINMRESTAILLHINKLGIALLILATPATLALNIAHVLALNTPHVLPLTKAAVLALNNVPNVEVVFRPFLDWGCYKPWHPCQVMQKSQNHSLYMKSLLSTTILPHILTCRQVMT